MKIKATKPNKYYPDDFDSQQDFLLDMVQKFNDDVTTDYFNIQAMLEDAAFVAGQHWDPLIQQVRLQNQKPTLTINTAPAFVAQVVGNRLLNETAIRVIPDQGGTKEIAKVRQGLIRSIEKDSRADRAYDNALQNCVIGGLGNFMVTTEYAANDVFDQKITIKSIINPAAVVWDRMRTEPTGRDAAHVFVQDLMPRKEFEKIWPWAQPTEVGSSLAYTQMLQENGWVTADLVRICNYWRMRSITRTLAMLLDGKIVDVTDLPPDEWIEKVAMHPATGIPIVRETQRTYAELCVCSATNVLEGPYRIWTDRVPVFRVPAWEIQVGDTPNRFGLIRFAKDPMRLRNYWRSVVAEKLMQTPKAMWVATKEAVAGHEERWRNAHLSNDTLLVWNGDAGAPPERADPAQMEEALITAAGMATQDIKDVTNLHEANLGMTSNEVSGKAILSRQRIGEIGTVIYQHNLTMAIEECGRVINDMIPYVYDTPRIVKVLGEDGVSELQKINDPNDPQSIDITVGKYQIAVTTGPSYATRRVEAVESMQALFNAAPETFAVAADLFVENMDWPGADAIADRLKNALPPNMRGEKEMSPEEQQQMAAAQEQQQMQAQMAQMMAEAEIAKKQAEVGEAQARIMEAQARAELYRAQVLKTMADAEKSVAGAEKLEAEAERLEYDDERDSSGNNGEYNGSEPSGS